MKSVEHIGMSGVTGDGHQTRDVLELARLGKAPVLKVSESAVPNQGRMTDT